LRESEARYRTLAEAAHDSIFIVDKDRRIEYANAVTLARFNITSDAAIGKVLDEVFAPGVVAEMWSELQEVFSSGERRYFEARFDAAAGDLWLGTWLVPMAREPGGKLAIMGLSRDITERKRLEREFAQAQKMEAIGRLAGGIAHDFNNLLTAILGYGEFVQERVRHDPTLTADVYEIRRAGERASRLTRQLLTFSRKQASSPRVLDLNEVVTDLEKMLTRVIGEDIFLEIVTDPALDHTKVDPSQIEQLIVNLVVNARDALPRGGIVRMHTRNVELGTAFARDHEGATPGRYVALVVEDNGCGMTPDVLSHVFEPFFTTKPEGKGTGLGLSTVYGIVKQSGGYITIDSTLGVGTTITSYFPVADIATEAAAATSVTKPAAGSETILLVEDEPGLRRLMHRTLEQYGYHVLSSENVPEVLKMAERHDGPIDLLVTDIVMPGLAGPDLAQRLIRLRPSMKVLYVSGFSNRAAHAASSPRTCFLAKPFTPHVLATRVRECLDGRPIHGIGC
jgi:PAS domain S-box-containing protein